MSVRVLEVSLSQWLCCQDNWRPERRSSSPCPLSFSRKWIQQQVRKLSSAYFLVLQISQKIPCNNKHVFKIFTKEKMHALNSFTNICPCSLSGLHSYIRVAGIGCKSQKCHSQHNNHQWCHHRTEWIIPCGTSAIATWGGRGGSPSDTGATVCWCADTGRWWWVMKWECVYVCMFMLHVSDKYTNLSVTKQEKYTKLI